ncbi:hypothetical protein [Micromonospora carbonacea]|uniref:Type IV secretion system protein n=1 Tax=Micromonospora carbonacea TaxID=47853 RepID=A0A1C5AY07_9ACTN|nr:hypothetical protein [Micromonospora carbonacea]SCF50098.1 hypothetical protein GA0070563_12646 [Micromonospora carbonacea]
MCVPVVDPLCLPGKAVESTAGHFLEEIAEQMAEAAAEMLRAMVTGWLSIPTPDVTQESGTVAYLRAYTSWAVAAVAVAAVLVAAGRLAWERDGREAGTFGKGLVTMVVLAGAGVPAVQLLITIGDSYSNWILDAAADGDLGNRLLTLAPAAATNGLSALMVTGLSMMVFTGSLVQLLMLLGRGVGLVLLPGLLPLVASAGISRTGQSVRDRYLTWLLALVLYKPTAATIYAAAFWMLGHGQDLTTLLTGLVAFFMAIVALPALMRLLAPAVSALSSGGSGGVAAAAVSSGGQIASGAIRLSNAAGGSGRGQGDAGTSGPGRADGATPSTPVPSPRPAGGGGAPAPGAGATGSASAGTGTAAAGAGSAGAGAAGAGAGAAGAGAAAAGPVGMAAAAGVAAAKAGPTVVRKVGGTAASGAVEGEG